MVSDPPSVRPTRASAALGARQRLRTAWPGPCRLVGALAISLSLVASACSGDDGAGSARDAGGASVPVDADGDTTMSTEPVVTADDPSDRTSEDDADGTGGSGPAVTASGAVSSVPPTSGTGPEPLPDVGVPGLDDDEVLCRSWSRIAGSFQAVAVAWAFGEDERSPYRLETTAAHVVVRARDDMVDSWPEELADERDAVTDRYLGPFVRRAERVLAALDDAGADDATYAALDEAWIAALGLRAPDEPVLDVVLTDDLEALVAVAVADVAADLPPVPQDPSLVTEVAIPRTEAFVAERCPDRGTLAGSDPVG